MSKENEIKLKKKKYKQTKELVRLALNNGWTQTDIAKKCRTNQSVVSGWKAGSSKATEDQLRPLIDEFGHKMRRKTFKVYWNLSNDGEHVYFRVEGRVIMDHDFSNHRRDPKSGKSIRKHPERRLIVHDQGDDQYLLLRQSRLLLTETAQMVDSSVPAAGWVTDVIDDAPKSKHELLEYIDVQCDVLLKELPADAVTLPFLIRRALLFAGKSVSEVIDYPAKR